MELNLEVATAIYIDFLDDNDYFVANQDHDECMAKIGGHIRGLCNEAYGYIAIFNRIRQDM